MTFQEDVLADTAAIINGEFSHECIHTPKRGVPQPSFNCLKDETILHGDNVTTEISPENTHITVITSEVIEVEKQDSILLNGVDYEVVGNPYISLKIPGSSGIDLRRERTQQTLI